MIGYNFVNLVNFEGTICNLVHFENLTGYNLKNLTIKKGKEVEKYEGKKCFKNNV